MSSLSVSIISWVAYKRMMLCGDWMISIWVEPVKRHLMLRVILPPEMWPSHAHSFNSIYYALHRSTLGVALTPEQWMRSGLY